MPPPPPNSEPEINKLKVDFFKTQWLAGPCFSVRQEEQMTSPTPS